MQCIYIILVRFSINCCRIICCIPHGLIFIHITHAIVFQINHDTKELHPPFLSLSVQSSFSFDRNILGIYRINQRLETFHHHSFMTNLDKRKIVIKVIGKEQGSSGFQLQCNITFQMDTPRQVSSGRKEKSTSAATVQTVNR